MSTIAAAHAGRARRHEVHDARPAQLRARGATPAGSTAMTGAATLAVARSSRARSPVRSGPPTTAAPR